MNTKHRILLVEAYLNRHNAAMEQLDRLMDTVGASPESPFFDTIYRLDSLALEMTAWVIGDARSATDTWLSWWLYEKPEHGDGGTPVTIDGKGYPAETVADLVAIIEAWNGEQA